VKVLLAEGQRLLGDGLRRAVDEQSDVRVVRTAASFEEVEVEAPRFTCDVAVLDWRLPGGGAIAAAQVVRAAQPGCRILVLADLVDVDAVAEALRAGCDGFLTRDCSLDGLLDALRSVWVGDPVLSPAAASTLAKGHRDRADSPLSDRELEIVGCLAKGMTNREIAESLYLSVHTVRNHVQRICRRLGAHSRLEVVITAARLGLVGLVPR